MNFNSYMFLWLGQIGNEKSFRIFQTQRMDIVGGQTDRNREETEKENQQTIIMISFTTGTDTNRPR